MAFALDGLEARMLVVVNTAATVVKIASLLLSSALTSLSPLAALFPSSNPDECRCKGVRGALMEETEQTSSAFSPRVKGCAQIVCDPPCTLDVFGFFIIDIAVDGKFVTNALVITKKFIAIIILCVMLMP